MNDIIEGLVIFSLLYGLSGWIFHLIFITMSLRSKTKGLIEIYYNKWKELYPEIILMICLIIFNIIILILFIRGIY